MRNLLFLLLLLVASGAAPAAAGTDEEFVAAHEAFRKHDQVRLDAAITRLQGHVLAPYLAFWQMELRLKDASQGEILDFIKANPGSPLSERLRADWLKLVGEQQNWPLFLSEYSQFAGEDPELACYALRARLAQGDSTAAQQAHRLWFDGSTQAAGCEGLFESLIASGDLNADDIRERIRLALEAGNISVALAAGRHLEGQEAERLRALDSIADNPRRFLETGGGDLATRVGRELTVFAIYRLARVQPRQALPYWHAVRQRFSPADQRHVWGQLALYAARKHDADALKWYAEAGDTPLNELQHAWKARAALREQGWVAVLAAIEAMPEGMQRKGVWRYWKARGLRAQGSVAEANAILAPLSREYNFYGQLATEELGTVVSNPEVAYRPSDEEVKAMRQMPGVERALALHRLGLRAEANLEWRWTIRGFDDKQLLAAAEVAQRNDWVDCAINTADKTRRLHDFNLRYPLPYRELMRAYTRQRDLDESWVYGLIRQESRFFQQTLSNVGASGLMQLMPGTAQWVAKRLGVKNFRSVLINQLDTNISFGTYYLKYVLDVNDGQPVLATAAYNAGPVRAKQWKDARSLEGAIYTESIPFTETRDYVQKVMSNATYYANRFGQQLLTLKQRLGIIAGKNASEDCKAADERSPSCDR